MSLGQTKWLHTYRSLLAMKKNPTLIKNMPYVKHNQIPPVKGPDSQGIKTPIQQPKRFKTILTVSKPKT